MPAGELTVGRKYRCPVCQQKIRLLPTGLKRHRAEEVRDGTLWIGHCEGTGMTPRLES